MCLCVLNAAEAGSGAKSVEDWRCPSSRPHYSTHHHHSEALVTSQQGHINTSATPALVDAAGARDSGGGQLASRSSGELEQLATVSESATADTEDDQWSLSTLTYVLITLASVILLLVIVGTASYLTAAYS